MNRKFLNTVNLDGGVIIKKGSGGGGGGGVAINNQSKSVEFTENGTSEVKYDAGYTGLEKVSVKVAIPVESKSVTIVENGTSEVAADEGYLDKVSINVAIPTEEKTIEITENGTTEVVADNGFLNKVIVNTNVASSGGGTSSSYRGQVWDTLFNPAPVDDGATTLFINITRDNQKTFVVVFVQSEANGVVIDWGDGITETKTKVNAYNYCEHTYSSFGRYQIKLIPKEGCTYELGSGSTTHSYSVIGNAKSTSLHHYDACYRVDIGRGVTNIGKAISHTMIQQVNFVNDDVSIDQQSFYAAKSIYYIKIPKRAKTIGYRAFGENTSTVLYDFSEVEVVPTLDSEAFLNINLYSIIVPDSLYDEFISATNWSNQASHIVRLSDFIK